ncbi:peroxisomal assembly protein [Massospora cicadina]|nr:peroxisomal assembly protein [Massospora cicadina]
MNNAIDKVMAQVVQEYGCYACLVTDTDTGHLDLYPGMRSVVAGGGRRRQDLTVSAKSYGTRYLKVVPTLKGQSLIHVLNASDLDDQYVFAQLYHIRDVFSSYAQRGAGRRGPWEENPSNPTTFPNRLLLKIKVQTDAVVKLGDEECYIPLCYYERTNCFGLRVLLWPAKRILLNEAILEVGLADSTTEAWEEGSFRRAIPPGFVDHTTCLVLIRSDKSQDRLSPASAYASSFATEETSLPEGTLSMVVDSIQFISAPRRLRIPSSNASPTVMSRRASEQELGAENQWPFFEAPWPAQSGALFQPTVLETECWLRLLPGFETDEIDTHSAILVPLRALSQLKVVSGDWVLAKMLGAQTNHPDGARSLASASVNFPGLSFGHGGRAFALMDPVLHFNLGAHLAGELAIQKVAGRSQPATASSVTLARISSPLSNQKSLQLAIAAALRRHLTRSSRSVCVGDVIPVVVDEATAQLQPRLVGDGDLDASFSLSALAQVQTGLGIDPAFTKVLQAGVEHSCVPRGLRSFYHLKPCSAEDVPFRQLQALVRSVLDPRAADLDIHCSVLIYGPRGAGKAELVRRVADSLGIHLVEVACYALVEESEAKTQDKFSEWFTRVGTYAPCVFALTHLDALAKKFSPSDVQQEPWLSTMFSSLMARLYAKRLPHPVVVMAMAESIEKFPPGILGVFRHEIKLEAPPERARRAILAGLTSRVSMAPDVSLDALATETAALVANDLVDLVERAGGFALTRLDDCHAGAGVALIGADFDLALSQSRAQYSDNIGAPKIPSVTWEDVGGLAEHPELFTSGAKKRSGILLYGPPGTGKTLLAKAVATSCSLNFFSVKGPELLNMYIGESEANVRRVFQKARDAKPCVIFFDELDSVAPKRGEQGDSGGVMDRIVSQLLAELDGMGKVDEVFVVGATNRPDLLDPALLRPGRFDKMLYLGVPQDHDSQLNIIQALTRNFHLDPALDLRDVALLCPFHFTGADFYALCSDAMLKAMTRTANAVEDKLVPPMSVSYYLDHVARPEELSVVVTKSDFERALDELSPSVTPAELAHYQEIQFKFAHQTLNSASGHPKLEASNARPAFQLQAELPFQNGKLDQVDPQDSFPFD